MLYAEVRCWKQLIVFTSTCCHSEDFDTFSQVFCSLIHSCSTIFPGKSSWFSFQNKVALARKVFCIGCRVCSVLSLNSMPNSVIYQSSSIIQRFTTSRELFLENQHLNLECSCSILRPSGFLNCFCFGLNLSPLGRRWSKWRSESVRQEPLFWSQTLKGDRQATLTSDDTADGDQRRDRRVFTSVSVIYRKLQHTLNGISKNEPFNQIPSHFQESARL